MFMVHSYYAFLWGFREQASEAAEYGLKNPAFALSKSNND